MTAFKRKFIQNHLNSFNCITEYWIKLPFSGWLHWEWNWKLFRLQCKHYHVRHVMIVLFSCVSYWKLKWFLIFLKRFWLESKKYKNKRNKNMHNTINWLLINALVLLNFILISNNDTWWLCNIFCALCNLILTINDS